MKQYRSCKTKKCHITVLVKGTDKDMKEVVEEVKKWTRRRRHKGKETSFNIIFSEKTKEDTVKNCVFVEN